MVEENDIYKEKPPVGNLTDFAKGCTKDNPLDIIITVDDRNRVLVFHDKYFTHEISWFEFDISSSKLDFVMDSGEIRDVGLPLNKEISKYMQNTHQILTIFMDDDTGEAKEGDYIPLILHR